MTLKKAVQGLPTKKHYTPNKFTNNCVNKDVEMANAPVSAFSNIRAFQSCSFCFELLRGKGTF